jgi:hypothetical protein
VNDVMFSYRSFFSREVLGKGRGLSIFVELLCFYELNATSYHHSLKSFQQQFASSQLFI